VTHYLCEKKNQNANHSARKEQKQVQYIKLPEEYFYVGDFCLTGKIRKCFRAENADLFNEIYGFFVDFRINSRGQLSDGKH